jgi:hypothetical protein
MALNAKFVRYVRLSRAKTVWSFLYTSFMQSKNVKA